MNFCLRGCYVSMAKFKFPYRRMEAEVPSAEALETAVSSLVQRTPRPMNSCWDDVCFNSFHDILPGSSTERAYDDQIAWLGRTRLETQRATLDAVNALAARIDTQVRDVPYDKPCAVPVLVWNPHPLPLRTHAEVEVALDYRPLWDYAGRVDELPLRILGPDGKKLPYQTVPCEAEMMPDLPWRRRVVVPLDLPPMGWQLLEAGVVDGARKPKVKSPVAAPTKTSITNGIYEVKVRKGRTFIEVLRKGKPVFKKGLQAISVDDPWGSWGSLQEHPESHDLSTVMERWKVTEVELLESGPERASLWVRLAGERSRLDLTFQLYRNRDAVDVSARVFWNERYRRLKLVMPAGDQAEFEVPGGVVKRGPSGEVPGGRWVRVKGPKGSFGFASDALYGFDCKNGEFRVSIVRSTGYTKEKWRDAQDSVWRPQGDAGELCFRFLLSPGDGKLPKLAKQLEQPLVVQTVLPSPGDLPRCGSVMELEPSNIQLLALKPAEDGNGIILRVQETGGRKTAPRLTWLGQQIILGEVGSRKIATWRLTRGKGSWLAARTDILERVYGSGICA
jgi:alpha-mannosidase